MDSPRPDRHPDSPRRDARRGALEDAYRGSPTTGGRPPADCFAPTKPAPVPRTPRRP